jgi:predicted nucleic acid-binding protein
MIRVVLDTNVMVSALLQPLVQLCVSGDVYAEYEEVVRRPRLARDEEVITSTLQMVREKSFWVKPTETIKACSDPDDDIFIECATRRTCGRNTNAPAPSGILDRGTRARTR